MSGIPSLVPTVFLMILDYLADLANLDGVPDVSDAHREVGGWGDSSA